MGRLVSGASIAALTALAVARHAKCAFSGRKQGVQRSSERFLLFTRGEVHGCHQRAAELLGIGSANLRAIERDEARRTRPDVLKKQIRMDLMDGHRPPCVIATAGTVNTVWLHVDGAYGAPGFSEFGFQQTRGFRALKVWMALRFFGISGYRAFIERDIALARHLFARLKDDDEFEVLEPQSLSIVCFRYVRSAAPLDDPQALDSLNKTLLERLQLGGGAFLSSTVLDDIFWLRACVINPRTTQQDMNTLIELIREIGAGL